MELNSRTLKKFISLPESDFLDFKEIHHHSTTDLLHDILCLANSYYDGNRFLVFGISDDKQIVGVQNNHPRRNLANLNNFLQTSHLNRIPYLKMKTFKIKGNQIDVLIIENRPNKPYFLLRDFGTGNNTIRAGIIYSRVGDTNTPKNSTAKEDLMELIWRERFGIGTPPLNRVLDYLNNPEQWVKVQGDEYIYHRIFPEFTIQTVSENASKFEETWSKKFPDPIAYRYTVFVMYLQTRLMRITYISCDGGRYMIPLPKIRQIGKSTRREFYLIKDSIEFKIATIFKQYEDLANTLVRIKIKIYDNKINVPKRRR